MTEETKAKIKAAHLKRAEDPAVVARLRSIANDPDMKAARSVKMKALWADPTWRAKQQAKMTPVVEAPAKKKRIISAEKKQQYAAARKAKRAKRLVHRTSAPAIGG